MVPDFPQSKWASRENKEETVDVFYKLVSISKTTHRYLHFILFVTNKLLSPSHSQGKN